MQRLEWHKARGDEVVVVSASLDVYLEPWCDAQGIHCVCTRLEERDGVLTGRYVEGDCTGPEKARRVLARFDRRQYASVYAYGDTSEDEDLLAIADRPFYRSWDWADPR
jgi:HAD superfamily phosphoserine phosphatase-like hydrolase